MFVISCNPQSCRSQSVCHLLYFCHVSVVVIVPLSV